jgi:hypothetical protein
MNKEQYLQNISWAKHSRNSDEGGKRKVNKMRRRNIKKEHINLKELLDVI